MTEQQLLVREGNPLLAGWMALGLPDPHSFGMRKPTVAQVMEAARILQIDTAELDQIHASLKRYGDDLDIIGPHILRRPAVQKYAWAIPHDIALDTIASFGDVIEVMAGTGYWASMLSERGVNVAAYDLYPPGHPENHWHVELGVYHQVDVAGVEVAAQYPERTLLLSWPPYAPDQNVRFSPPEEPDDWQATTYELSGREYTTWHQKNTDPDIALVAALAYEQAGGRRIIYIGEGPGGCTAGPAFHTLMGLGCDHWRDDECECEDGRWHEVDDVAIPQWDGLHDRLYVFEPNNP